MTSSSKRAWPVAAILLFSTQIVVADGIVVSRLYHPYIQPLEQELEWRAVLQDEQPDVDDDLQVQTLSYGRSISDKWFAEISVGGSKSNTEHFHTENYGIEFKRQLSEQGEYWADWGWLFELEKEAQEDIWEFVAGPIMEKESGRWSTTVNMFLISEWGDDIKSELEMNLNMQLRYRYSRLFEPALESYNGQDTNGIGPVILGQARLGGRQQLKWEAGIIYGVNDESPGRTTRLLLEYEF